MVFFFFGGEGDEMLCGLRDGETGDDMWGVFGRFYRENRRCLIDAKWAAG